MRVPVMHAAGMPLFVYGTLLSGSAHPNAALLWGHSEWLGYGWIKARLYMIDDPADRGGTHYPGALPSAHSEDRVFGEVYKVLHPDIVFPVLDEYEACSVNWPEPHEFILRSLPVTMEDGEEIVALSYLYSFDVSQARPILSGRYRPA